MTLTARAPAQRGTDLHRIEQDEDEARDSPERQHPHHRHHLPQRCPNGDLQRNGVTAATGSAPFVPWH